MFGSKVFKCCQDAPKVADLPGALTNSWPVVWSDPWINNTHTTIARHDQHAKTSLNVFKEEKLCDSLYCTLTSGWGLTVAHGLIDECDPAAIEC